VLKARGTTETAIVSRGSNGVCVTHDQQNFHTPTHPYIHAIMKHTHGKHEQQDGQKDRQTVQ
jgi:hypothetical protein